MDRVKFENTPPHVSARCAGWGLSLFAIVMLVAPQVMGESGWYLVAPPVHIDRTADIVTRADSFDDRQMRNLAPFLLDDAARIAKWRQIRSFDSASECEAYRAESQHKAKSAEQPSDVPSTGIGKIDRLLLYRTQSELDYSKCVDGESYFNRL